ncbi:glycosyltransferase [Allorhodopirellula solitaria]|uniref:glycosyltransferase n=1 Tax=Allorhodopirellula solitaria TaxID=2527987 RepID=UPI001645CEDD|nr:glycosyltransferase [Allorhodopirellula solitaria]
MIQLNWTSHLIDWADFFRSSPEVPIVWRFADLNPMTGGCHYPDFCNGFLNGCRGCPQIHDEKAKQRIASNFRLKGECIARIPSELMTIVAQSEWMDSLVAQSPIFKRFPRVIIPNGVNKSLFRRVDRGFCREFLNVHKSAPIALVFGSDGAPKRKGAHALLDQLEKLGKLPFHLLIVGDSKHSIGRRPEVTIVESLPSSYLSLLYSAVDLVLFPSLQDNCPNTVLESQACGVPVLAFDNSGTKELVDGVTNGYLVADRDFQGFVRKACSLLTTQTLPPMDLVRRSVRDFQDMLSDYMTLYRKVASMKDLDVS